MTTPAPGQQFATGDPLAPFLQLRTAMTAARTGSGGFEACAALTEAMDGCVRELSRRLPVADFALVAVGGYGRRQLCLQSDIDLMLLRAGAVPTGAVQAIFYPLWDAKLKVGHAVRSVRETLRAAADTYETLTALLDARLIAGTPALLEELERGLIGLLKRTPLREYLSAAYEQRRAREPYTLLEANLKDGRGGLRDVQGLHWDRRRRQLLGLAVSSPTTEERQAHDALLAARNGLHAVAGRPYELYVYDLRPAVAAWQGLDTDSAGRRLYGALRTVSRIAAVYWSVSDSDARRPPLPARWRRASRTTAPIPPEAARSPLELALHASRRGRDSALFTSEEERHIRAAPGPSWEPRERQALIKLLAAGQRGREAFLSLEQLGWVSRGLPEWRHVVAAPQHAPFHLHPVDDHLWRTAIELQEIVRPDSGEQWCSEVAAELGSLDDALLAAILHDIGKGWPGDHSVAGARAVAALLRRARFGPSLAGTVTAAVRNHLLLPDTATRRDSDDPAVIVQVADKAGDLRCLRVLYLLAVADSRATGPGVWGPWKAALVRTLFARTAEELARRAGAVPISSLEEQALASLEAASAGRFELAAVREHVRAMPAGYLTAFTTPDLLRHLATVLPPPEAGTVAVDVRHGAAASSAIVVTEDAPGLLAAISGVFALHNVSVLDGRFYTRADGLVIDTFHVDDALGGAIEERRWQRVRQDMGAVIRGELPLEQLLTEKAYAYRAELPMTPVRVVVDAASSENVTLVEVHGTDRVGLLHDIARALFDLELDIRLAKIDTRGREVIDTFYVHGQGGETVRERRRLDALAAELSARLNHNLAGCS